jgi:hypothetical protein
MQEPLDAEVEELGGPLYLRALSEDERIPHDEAQIAIGTLDLRVAELAQQLPSPKGRPFSRQRTVAIRARRVAPYTACCRRWRTSDRQRSQRIGRLLKGGNLLSSQLFMRPLVTPCRQLPTGAGNTAGANQKTVTGRACPPITACDIRPDNCDGNPWNHRP